MYLDFCPLITQRAAWESRKGAFRFTLMAESHCSSVTSRNSALCSTAGLFTKMSIFPQISSVNRTSRSTATLSARSTTMYADYPPSLVISSTTERSWLSNSSVQFHLIHPTSLGSEFFREVRLYLIDTVSFVQGPGGGLIGREPFASSLAKRRAPSPWKPERVRWYLYLPGAVQSPL